MLKGVMPIVGDELARDPNDHNRQDRIDLQGLLPADVGGGEIANKDSNTSTSTIDPLAPPPAEDAGSKPVVTVGSGADSVVAVVAAGSCVSETSSLVFEQELTAISERHTTATNIFKILRSSHKQRAQSGHLTACCGSPTITEPGLRNWLDITPRPAGQPVGYERLSVRGRTEPCHSSWTSPDHILRPWSNV